MAILLAGCMMATEKQAEGIYEESVLSLDTILVLEEVQPIYALESAPIMEVEMVEERSMAMKTMVEPDTLIKDNYYQRLRCQSGYAIHYIVYKYS